MRRTIWILVSVAVLSLAGAGTAYQAFVRQAPTLSGIGVITSAELVPTETWARRAMTPRGPTVAERRVLLPARYRFTITVTGEPQPLRYGLDTSLARAFSVGERVRVTYERRGLPPLWERAYVREMRAAPAP